MVVVQELSPVVVSDGDIIYFDMRAPKNTTISVRHTYRGPTKAVNKAKITFKTHYTEIKLE